MASLNYYNENTQKWETIKTEALNSVIPNTQSWVSVAGQDTFQILNGKIINVKLLKVTVGGVFQNDITLINDITFKISEMLPAGVNVYAEWFEVKIPAANGHQITHEIGGQDELDITKLRNYDLLSLPMAENAKKVTWVSPENYGAKGDGVTDDTLAVQTAINEASAKKVSLQLSSGKTYLISSQLLITAQTSIIGCPSHRPIIRVKSQSFDPIKAQGTYVTATTLTASATVNTKWLDVASASGITPNMLIEVKSSLSWYHDPRPESSDCRKAELHRVDAVLGNRIYVTDPLFDGYDIALETVTVSAYTPIRVHMENIELTMDLEPAPQDTVRKTGISLRHTVDSTLENVFVSNAQNCGIWLYHSYRPTVIGGRTVGANNYFSGYGVQTYGTTHARIANRHMRNCRRGVDISGGTMPSHFSTIEGCSAFGNGKNSLNDNYTYNDNHSAGTYACGFGTHGGADHTTFRNNTMGFVHVGIEDRARNTTVENNYFIGDFYTSCIEHSYGENLTVKGNIVYDGFSGVKNATVFDGGANFNTRKPERFLVIFTSAMNNGSSGGFIVVENNHVHIRDSFISFSGTSSVTTMVIQKNMIVKNNHAFFYPQMSTDPAYFFKNDTFISTILLGGSTVRGNTYERGLGSGTINFLYGVDLRDKSEVESPRTFSFYLTDNTASSIILGSTTTNWARLMIDSNSTYGLVRVTNTSTASSPVGTTVNVETSNGALTGTTGNIGKVTVSLIDGKLYVENRYGSTQRIMVTVMNYM